MYKNKNNKKPHFHQKWGSITQNDIYCVTSYELEHHLVWIIIFILAPIQI